MNTKLLLLGIILISFATATAIPVSTIQFNSGDITSGVLTLSKRGCNYIWDGKVTIKEKTIEYTRNYITYTETLPAGTYDSKGYVCFDTKIPIGVPTPIKAFRLDIFEDGVWTWKVESIPSGSKYYEAIRITRTSENTYELVVDNTPDMGISTAIMDTVHGGPLGSQRIEWDFTAKILR